MKNISRRNFLAKGTAFSALASTIQFLPSRILAKDATAPSNTINVACFGTGGIAKGHLQYLASSPRTRLMALCDVDQKKLNSSKAMVDAAAKKNKNVAFREVDVYEEYMDILGRDDIDAVWICTPDHWHVQMAVSCLLRGKAVYVEKPISLTVEEGKILVDVVKKTNGVLQNGSQQRSTEQFRVAAELVRNGYLGKMKRIDVSIGQFPEEPKNLKEEPIPAGFNYDKWLGQTPYFPYNAQRVKGQYSGGWRCFLEYGARKEGDWGAHHYDIVQWALNRDASGPCEFHPENTNGEPLRHFKYDTGETVYVNNPEVKGQTIRFTGEEASITVNRSMISCTKPELLKMPLKKSDQRLQVSVNDHRGDLLNAFAYGHKNITPASVGHRTATVCQLMSIARRTNESFKWDAKTETISQGSNTVKSMLSRPRRAPYFIETKA
ncbi:MAG: Gfo/Idh/MocA family oxidoreductase [Opitutales bacterium]